MGAGFHMMIEYDEEAYPHAPFSSDIDGVIDFTKCRDIMDGKPYELMQALAGVRGSVKKEPLIKPRGFPMNMHWEVKEYFEEWFEPGDRCTGWVHYSELMRCLAHHDLHVESQGFSVAFAFQIFKDLADRLGDDRVRMIFAIDSP